MDYKGGPLSTAHHERLGVSPGVSLLPSERSTKMVHEILTRFTIKVKKIRNVRYKGVIPQ